MATRIMGSDDESERGKASTSADKEEQVEGGLSDRLGRMSLTMGKPKPYSYGEDFYQFCNRFKDYININEIKKTYRLASDDSIILFLVARDLKRKLRNSD